MVSKRRCINDFCISPSRPQSASQHMQIPFVDLAAQYHSIKDEIDAAMNGVVRSSAFIKGPQLSRFEEAFSAIHGNSGHVIGVNSGTDALHLAVRACGIGPGDEVISVPNTWISTLFSASYVGARPVLVDIDPDTYQMDPAALAAAITPKTKAIIPVHMFGHPAPMDAIRDVVGGRDIRIIEDVAQAPLAETGGRTVGAIGDIACYSFYPSKNLGCYGDGGAVMVNDPALVDTVRMLADYGQVEKCDHRMIGYNSRLDTLQAAVLEAKLPYLRQWTEARRKAADTYNRVLSPLPVKRPGEAGNGRAVYHIYAIQLDDRDACLDFMREKGVMCQIHYPQSVHLQPCYAELGYRRGDFPVAETLAARGLSLPMYPEITDAQIEYVGETLAGFLKSKNRM